MEIILFLSGKYKKCKSITYVIILGLTIVKKHATQNILCGRLAFKGGVCTLGGRGKINLQLEKHDLKLNKLKLLGNTALK